MPGFSWVREVWDEAYYTNAIKHGIFFSFFFFFFAIDQNMFYVSQNMSKFFTPETFGRMGTSFGCGDFWDR